VQKKKAENKCTSIFVGTWHITCSLHQGGHKAGKPGKLGEFCATSGENL